jgi:soluble lytic murein transglycosylase-like protein
VIAGGATDRCEAVRDLAGRVAEEHRLDPALVMGIMRVESNFDPRARSRAGATGLMQVMPAVAKRAGCGDLDVPEENLRCGAGILVRFLDHYDDNLVYALSAYHAGYRWATEASRGAGLPKNFRYVEKVLSARSWYIQHGCARVTASR